MGNLGQRLTVYGFACNGAFSREYLERSLTEIVRTCRFRPVGEPLSWGYPLDGRGGVGETIFLPFGEGQLKLGWLKKLLLRFLMRRFRWTFLLFQPFTESFAVIDSYPDLKDEQGKPTPKVVIVLASCLPIDEKMLRIKVRRRFGSIIGQGRMEL
ncbi:MAG: hypothetical protein JRI66_12310 [Deltaproteobacteria bacterium]|nr:hypothetical protein [Deltaproteobacteria bacterium]